MSLVGAIACNPTLCGMVPVPNASRWPPSTVGAIEATRRRASSLQQVPALRRGRATATGVGRGGVLRSTRSLAYRRAAVSVAAGGSWRQVDVEAGKVLLEREGFKFLDLRTEREFDGERLTKPPRCSINVPIVVVDAQGVASYNPEFEGLLAKAVPGKSTKLLVASQSGEPWSSYAMQVLTALGYTEAVEVLGGYMAWTKVFSTSGRRRPPAGRWVSTGTEALKSGLNVGDAAASYTEGGDLQQARWQNSKGNKAPFRA